MNTNSRRNFVKKAAAGAAGVTLIGSTQAFSRIIGANDQVNVAIIGTGGRAYGLAKSCERIKSIKLTYVCDADKNRLDKFQAHSKRLFGYEPKAEVDFRKVLEKKDVDAIFVATPEHWHAPMAIMGMQAGKHVYVEKPCSHNPYETELLIQAQQKYGKVCQMGNQQRSSVTTAKAVKEINSGVIGKAYAAKAFYSNTRKSIGKGKEVSAPSYLNWDLWQGPAPREQYRDNIHPYNWHWFKSWGTGEIHNNGTHEIDICRWALGVGYPNRVSSAGGRLHYSNDDWEFYDTQMASYEFEGGKTITWEGRSCNGFASLGGRGAVVYGTEGTIHLNRAKYVLYGLSGKKIKTENEGNQGTSNSTADLTGFDGLTVRHIDNFINAIVSNEKLNSPIHDAGISTQLCHFGNLAQELQQSLHINSAGQVENNKAAKKLWKREYEKGWEPKI